MKKSFITIICVLLTYVVSVEAAEEAPVLEAYVKVATALSKDDLAAAKKAAAAIAEDGGDSVLAKSAEALSKAKSIEEARKEFKGLSKNAINLAKGREGFYLMHCPMVKGGGGDWLQTSKEVANPYFGASMLTCGGIKE